jgi:hypothetical protein
VVCEDIRTKKGVKEIFQDKHRIEAPSSVRHTKNREEGIVVEVKESTKPWFAAPPICANLNIG